MKVHFTNTPCNSNRTRRTSHRARITMEVAKVTCSVCRKLAALDNAEWVAKLVERGKAV
jgi:hypothetical protein